MRIELNGTTINYAERGMPNGLPVVFLHGFPFSHAMWDPQAAALPNAIRFIAPDMRGHGASDPGTGQYTIEFFVDDVIALLDHLSINTAVLCGLSMGGYIALRAIQRHPDRIRGLVLCDTKSEADTDAARINRSAAMRSVRGDGVETYAANFVKTVFAPKTLAEKQEIVEKVRRIIAGNTPAGICGTLLALMARTDTTPVLSSIAVPTLIMCGEHDQLTPPAVSRSMHEKIRNSELVILPDAAHMSNMENTPLFNEKLMKFLAAL